MVNGDVTDRSEGAVGASPTVLMPKQGLFPAGPQPDTPLGNESERY